MVEFFLFKFYVIIFICLLWAVLGLRCCTGFSLVAASRGYSLFAVHGLSLQRLLLLWSMGSGMCGLSSCGSWALEHRLSSCGAQAELLCRTWDLPGPGIEPVSPVLADRFLTTEYLGS